MRRESRTLKHPAEGPRLRRGQASADATARITIVCLRWSVQPLSSYPHTLRKSPVHAGFSAPVAEAALTRFHNLLPDALGEYEA
jgi:hypothetical protein